MSTTQEPLPLVRLAEPKDLDAIVEIETAGWPSGDGMRAERFKFTSRIECKFVWVACDARGEVLGMFSAFRPQWVRGDCLDELMTRCPLAIFDQEPVECWTSLVRESGLSRDWHEATAEGTLWHGAKHDPEGQVLYGVGLAIRREYKGKGIARYLLQSVLNQEVQRGARYFLGYGRLPMFHQCPEMDINAYLRLVRDDELGVRPFDSQLGFYWKMGAQPMRSVDGRFRYVGIPGSMREDPESRGYGLLVVTPIGATPFPLNKLS